MYKCHDANLSLKNLNLLKNKRESSGGHLTLKDLELVRVVGQRIMKKLKLARVVKMNIFSQSIRYPSRL